MKNITSLCNENDVNHINPEIITKEKLSYSQKSNNSNLQTEIINNGPHFATPQLFTTLYMMPFYIFPIIFN